MLVTNDKSALYNGVNQQSSEHRLETQVEECINAYPTVDSGLLKRNPTKKLDLSYQDNPETITLDKSMFVHEYDRGLSGADEEKYSIHITDGEMFIVNIATGETYTKANGGIVFNGSAEDYIFPFSGRAGYAAVTIKDTTFIVNKSKAIYMENDTSNPNDGVTQTYTYPSATINLVNPAYGNSWYMKGSDETGGGSYIKSWLESECGDTTSAPYEGACLYELGGNELTTTNFRLPKISIIVDGITIDCTPPTKPDYRQNNRTQSIDNDGGAGWVTYGSLTPIVEPNGKMSRSAYETFVYDKLKSVLSPNGYKVEFISGGVAFFKAIKITKYVDGGSINVNYSWVASEFHGVAQDPSNGYDTVNFYRVPDRTNYFADAQYSTTTSTEYHSKPSDYNSAFFWIKSANPQYPYTYSVSISSKNGTFSASSTKPTTTEAASDLASQINTNGTYTAVAFNSIVQVQPKGSDEITTISVTDTFGNQASFAWYRTVGNAFDLPKTLGIAGAVVKVNGDTENSYSSYWLRYDGSSWVESYDPNAQVRINAATMPHILTREFGSVNGKDSTYFKLSQYGKWEDRKVGDDKTNKLPSFVVTDGQEGYIKDIFFFKNRLGFITKRTVVMSEVGEYGNFWRTSVAALLDSDRIDTSVDTTKAIELEYATYLEDSLMLFSDKAQFKLDGGKTLTPSSIQVSQSSAYEFNKNVRPIFANNKLFFVAKRGGYSAVMQYYVDGNGRVSEAVDITAHVQRYIPDDIISLSSSSINNMLFLLSESDSDTIYVYKYIDSGKERVQSAWFKWTYNGEVFNAFSLGKKLNILIRRNQASVVTDWVLGSSIWQGDKLWTSDGIWYGNETQITTSDNFEVQPIVAQDYLGYYVDASELVEDTTTATSLTSTVANPSAVVYSSNIYLRTDVIIEVINPNMSTYTLVAKTNIGNMYSVVDDKLTITRNPREVITSIELLTPDIGVDMNGFTARYTDDKDRGLLYNNDFKYGTDNWIFDQDWMVNYGKKDIGSLIPVDVNLGEWVLTTGGKANNRGHLKFKTCKISSEYGSSFKLKVRDVKRNDERLIDSLYTVDRKPMIYGAAKDVRIHIINNDTKGFKINSVSFEGQFNSRNRRA